MRRKRGMQSPFSVRSPREGDTLRKLPLLALWQIARPVKTTRHAASLVTGIVVSHACRNWRTGRVATGMRWQRTIRKQIDTRAAPPLFTPASRVLPSPFHAHTRSSTTDAAVREIFYQVATSPTFDPEVNLLSPPIETQHRVSLLQPPKSIC